jgi:hypothetical protein
MTTRRRFLAATAASLLATPALARRWCASPATGSPRAPCGRSARGRDLRGHRRHLALPGPGDGRRGATRSPWARRGAILGTAVVQRKPSGRPGCPPPEMIQHEPESTAPGRRPAGRARLQSAGRAGHVPLPGAGGTRCTASHGTPQPGPWAELLLGLHPLINDHAIDLYDRGAGGHDGRGGVSPRAAGPRGPGSAFTAKGPARRTTVSPARAIRARASGVGGLSTRR